MRPGSHRWDTDIRINNIFPIAGASDNDYNVECKWRLVRTEKPRGYNVCLNKQDRPQIRYSV